MAGVTAFFHRGLCPLCGGGFRRCRFEALLFTPTEEQRQMPSGLPPLRLWRGKDCKKGTPVNPGCFCFSRECGGFACVGAVLGKRGSGIVTRLTGDARELLPAGAVQPVPCRLSKICAAVRHTETFHYSLFPIHSPQRGGAPRWGQTISGLKTPSGTFAGANFGYWESIFSI